jgi:hypothetical protein
LAQSTAARQLLQHLDQLLPNVQQQLDARGLSNIIWSCAYTKHMGLIAKLLPAFTQTLSGANSFDFANVLWALATLEQQVPQQQIQQLVAAHVRQAGTAAPQAIGNSLWAMGKLGLEAPPQQLGELLAAFTAKGMLGRCTTQAIANVLLGMAYMGQQLPNAQLGLLLAELSAKSHMANTQDVSNSLWAVGKLGQQVPLQQLGVLLAAFTSDGMLGRATTQEISNVLLGMACMSQQLPGAQLQLLLAELSAKAHMAKPQHLSNSLWAIAKLGQRVRDSQQLQQLVSAFNSKVCRATPQEMANTLWAVSEMGWQLPVLQLQPMVAAFVWQLPSAAAQGVSNMLLACARFRYPPMQLLAALEQQEQLQQFLAAAKPQELANTAWVYGTLGHDSELLLGAVLQQAMKLLQQDSSSLLSVDVSALCWAVAVLDLHQYVPEVLQLAAAAAASNVWDSAQPEELQQLYQVHLWLLDSHQSAAEGAKGPGLLQAVSPQQLEDCRRVWQASVAASAAAEPSLLQREVFAALQQLPGWQVPPQQEVVTADGNFSIDIAAVTAAGVKLAVEVDGPTHFVNRGNTVDGPTQYTVDGPTQYRNRTLAARGYTVVSIPFRDWGDLKGDQARLHYLQSKLQGTNGVTC